MNRLQQKIKKKDIRIIKNAKLYRVFQDTKNLMTDLANFLRNNSRMRSWWWN